MNNKPKLTDENLEEFKTSLTEFSQSVDEDLQNNDFDQEEIEELKALKVVSIDLVSRLNGYKKLDQKDLIELGMDLMAFMGIVQGFVDEDEDFEDEFMDDDEFLIEDEDEDEEVSDKRSK